MTLAEMENKWLNKTVKPRGLHWQIPIKEYVVTACLPEFGDDKETIFAVMAKDYSSENKHWFTIHVAPEDFDWIEKDFEVIQ